MEAAKKAEAAAKAAAEQAERDRMAAAKKEADRANAPWERPITWRAYTVIRNSFERLQCAR